MRAPVLFIYHGGCFDGFTSAWLFEKFYNKRKSIVDPPVTYYAAHYGEEPPDCKGKEVWIVDFSYPREVLIEKVIKPSTRTVILDHHKTAQEALDGILDQVRQLNLQRQNDKVIFDMNRSGAGILCDELEREAGQRAGSHAPRPQGGRSIWLVDYIEDRDLWKFKLPLSREVAAFYASVPMTFGEWDAIEALGPMKVAESGRAIQRYIDQYGVKSREQARFEEIGGYKVPTINVPYMNASDHVGRLAEENLDAPFAAGYFRKRDGTWQFSLRSRGGFDVSEVAKKYGGGGHPGAAGFEVEELPWTDKQGAAPTKDDSVDL